MSVPDQVFWVSPAALSRTSDLLGLNSDQLAEVLTHRSMILRGEEISTPLTVEQVSASPSDKTELFPGLGLVHVRVKTSWIRIHFLLGSSPTPS